jgi:predicted Fe-S protein YdhL (DUF1289 family)
MKSNCCKADVRVEGNTTKYYICKKCGKSCDIITNFFDLTEKEREEIVNEAVDKANKEQKELMDKYMPDIKQKLLEEFELKLHNVYATIFQLSGYDDKQLKEKMDVMTSFLSKAIGQTREETIREVEEILPDEYDLTESESVSLLNKIKQSLNKLKK